MTTTTSTSDHNKHLHFGGHHSQTSSYEQNHKHFHANSTAPAGFHLPHHASTAPDLGTIKSNDSDNEPQFPPRPPNQKPHHAHSLHVGNPHPIDFLDSHSHAFSHHHREMSFGHESRHAKHDAAKSHTSQMPRYTQAPVHMSQEEEIKLFEEQERLRKRKEEQMNQDKKSWEDIVKNRESARRRSGAAYERAVVEDEEQ